MLAYSVLNPHERNIYILKCKFIVSHARLVSAPVSRSRKMDFLKFQTILLETRHYHRGCPTIIKPAFPCTSSLFFSSPRLLSSGGAKSATSFLIISLTLRARLGDPPRARYFSYCSFHLSLRGLHLF